MPSWLLNCLELLCVAAFVAGVALIYVPAAFIVAGLLGVVAFEYLDRRLTSQKARAST